MAIRIRALGGRSGNVDTSQETHTLQYDAWDDTTRWASIAALYPAVTAFAPPTFLGLAPTSVTWEEDEENGRTTFSIVYGSGEAPEGILRISFDTSGGTVRMRTSRNTTSYPATGRTAPDFKNAVEVSDGEVQGTDVVIPALKLTFSYKWPKGVVQLADVRNLARLTGTTNNAAFYGFAAGELLFLGATGEIDPATPTDIQYQFAASQNASGLSIGDIAGITKAGHDHLWVLFEESEDTSAKKLVKRPLAAYVERLYDQSDFSALGIGTA